MAKIQVYVNDNVAEKINAIAVQRRAEVAKEKVSMKPRWNVKNPDLIRWHSIEHC